MLRFCDSFDHYSTSEMTTKWDTTSHGAGDNNEINAGGRFGSCIRLVRDGRWTRKNLGTAFQTWIVGFAFYTETTNTADQPIIAIADGTSTQIDIRINSSKQLYVTRNGTTLGTGSTALSNAVWVYIELKVKIDNSTGTVDLHLNGVSEISLTSQDTQATGNANATTIYLGSPAAAGFSDWARYDDLYVCDGTDSTISGAPNNDFLGDVRVEALFPNGNGTTSDLDGSDGNSTNNYLLVDEGTPNGDTDYVESGDVGDKDTYALTNLTPTSGVVYGVQVAAYAKKTDAGSRTLKLIARESGGTEEDSAGLSLTSSYQYFLDARDADPDAVQWTISSVNASEAGVKVAS